LGLSNDSKTGKFDASIREASGQSCKKDHASERDLRVSDLVAASIRDALHSQNSFRKNLFGKNSFGKKSTLKLASSAKVAQQAHVSWVGDWLVDGCRLRPP